LNWGNFWPTVSMRGLLSVGWSPEGVEKTPRILRGAV